MGMLHAIMPHIRSSIVNLSQMEEAKMMATNSTENREYRSDVFSMLMENADYALDVYNALNGTDYTDSSLIEIKTLEKGISLTIRNDAAFIIGADINIYEHQSTYNRNMPLRSLIYFAEIIKSYIKDKDIYGSKLINIPRPHFVVFYNGTGKRPEIEEQRLSDAYEHGEGIPLELVCIVYNINPDNNNNLKNKSYVLDGYTTFVEKVRELITQDDEQAVTHAIEYCILNDILKDFFELRKDEVRKNMTLDMTFEAREKIIRQEEYQDGLIEGVLGTIFSFYYDEIIDYSTAVKRSNLTESEFATKYEEWKSNHS